MTILFFLDHEILFPRGVKYAKWTFSSFPARSHFSFNRNFEKHIFEIIFSWGLMELQ